MLESLMNDADQFSLNELDVLFLEEVPCSHLWVAPDLNFQLAEPLC